MTRAFVPALFFLPLASACAATRELAASTPAAPATSGVAPAAASVEPRVPAATTTAEPMLRADELALWNDPTFRRRFAESYLAESDIEPRVGQDEREGLQAALESIAAERVDEAMTRLAELRGPTASAAIDFTLANLHFQREELAPAAAAYRAATDKFPKFRRAWRNLALIHVRLGEFQEAARAFTRVIELGGGDAITYGLLGYAHANLGGHLAAESAYRMAALLDPATMDWQMGLARSFFEQRRFADAVALTEGLIAAQPERADLWLLQANAFLGLGDSARAAENFELVERLGRSSADSLNTLADIYVNQGLATLAVDAYARAMALAPEAKPTRALRAAKVLTAGGALDETRRLLAEVEARHAERLEPGEKKELLALRARLALAAGAGAEEAAALREIVALDPLDGEALILLGQYHAREGDAEQAVFYYQRAAGLAAFEADAKVRHAQLLVRAGRLAEALPLLRRAQELQPRENIQKYLEDVQRHAEVR